MEINEVFDSIKEMANYANKDLGQNYLINQVVAKKIVDLLDIDAKDNVLEIGSGFGSLSIFLLNKNYKTITFNDIDPRSIEFLDNLVEHTKRAYVLNKSALKIDAKTYTKVISNIPYYITNDLLEHFLTKCNANKYVFMVQKEVINRVHANVGDLDYGPLSILVDYVGEYRKEFDVPKTDYLPMPHVASSVFTITKNNNNEIDKYNYLQFLKRMFLHRRKTIYNNLSLYLMDKAKAKDILDKLKISILVRPEQIPSNTYLSIYKASKK